MKHTFVCLLTFFIMVAFFGPVHTESVLERGHYLVEAVAACANCHTPRPPPGPGLSGGNRFTVGDKVVYAPNITPDAQTGIGDWTDAQIMTAIRDDVRPDGSRIGSPMPQHAFAAISDTDASAIIAYLRSVPAVSHRVVGGDRERDGGRTAPPTVVPDPSISSPTDLGRYLATGPAHCIECHRLGDGQAGKADRAFKGPWGTVVAPTLSTSNLARYKRMDFERLMRAGLRPDGSRIVGPMPIAAYAGLHADDVAAIADFLTIAR